MVAYLGRREGVSMPNASLGSWLKMLMCICCEVANGLFCEFDALFVHFMMFEI